MSVTLYTLVVKPTGNKELSGNPEVKVVVLKQLSIPNGVK